MVKMPRFETSCLETGIKTLVTETALAETQLLSRFSYYGFDPRFKTVAFKTGILTMYKAPSFFIPF